MQRVFLLGNRARDYGDVTEYLHIPQYLIAYGIAFSVAITAAGTHLPWAAGIVR